ncbi:ATPase synthesis protein 25 mitochondrial, partial [Ascosphaera aggregata]
MSKALLRCVRCQGGSNEAVRLLAGLAGITALRSTRIGQNASSRQRREFSQLSGNRIAGRNGTALPTAAELDIESGSVAEIAEKCATQRSPSSDPHVPWYLLDEMQEVLPQSPKKRQLLPELPDYSPPILGNVLQYISDTLGVNDLTLFDLRDIDPPPALGANVIMIIGTTRSFKHLNSSADRLCRWLRKEFKLRPDADGLLGRQELKLKLRRKARKAKLASSVGATIEDFDDGIVTRWVCINAGAIEDGRSAPAIPRVPGFVGFGTQSPTCQLIVQLMTEDKRAELDLETLWGGLLKKWAPTPMTERETSGFELHANSGHESLRSRVTYTNQQMRGLHTKANDRTYTSEKFIDPPSLMKSAGLPITTLPYGKPGLYNNWKESLVEPPYQTALLQNLGARPRQEIITALGNGPRDRDSTEFLRSFFSKISKYEFPYREAFKLELIRLAVIAQHPNYTKQDLYKAYQDLCFSGYDIPKAHG